MSIGVLPPKMSRGELLKDFAGRLAIRQRFGGNIYVLIYLADGPARSVQYGLPVASAALYFALNRGGDLVREYGKLNWAPFVLGIVIVGLEAGWIYAYKAGWEVSVGFIVQSAFLAVTLMIVGYLMYRETLTWNKLAGAAICMIGLAVINMK